MSFFPIKIQIVEESWVKAFGKEESVIIVNNPESLPSRTAFKVLETNVTEGE